MTIRYIDLNADLGERPDASGQDEALLHFVTSANVACGGHSGDEATMRRTLEMAKTLGVAVGAHPSFPDRENFGRIEMRMAPAELERVVCEQIKALVAIAKNIGVRVRHVKPHGALYHAANQNAEVGNAIAAAVLAVDSTMIVVGQAGSSVLDIYRGRGLRVATEGFADRAYEADGTLRSRKLQRSLLEEPSAAAAQALNIAIKSTVVTVDGARVTVDADTLCIHSDTPNSVEIAREIRTVLAREGVRFRSLE